MRIKEGRIIEYEVSLGEDIGRYIQRAYDVANDFDVTCKIKFNDATIFITKDSTVNSVLYAYDAILHNKKTIRPFRVGE